MFETFAVPATYIAVTGVLAMYSSGRVTGLSLECGEGYSCAMPVYEGQKSFVIVVVVVVE